jgi:hypothetical protein
MSFYFFRYNVHDYQILNRINHDKNRRDYNCDRIYDYATNDRNTSNPVEGIESSLINLFAGLPEVVVDIQALFFPE